jgi:glycosyltransferase involved in cell wall biosynthesis
MSTHLPLVTTLTPVYNGERYLAECIESVLNQEYENWEYSIVNNCSTDNTLTIALRYAQMDNRIHVINNERFVGVIENHNIAFRLISSESKYCKVVSSDDTITPDCLSKMVKLAEANPTIGIIGSYQKSGTEVKWEGLPHNKKIISGQEVCRLTFLDNLIVFGNPTSSLYRCDLIRKKIPFFPHLLPHADTSACYKYLQNTDYGFVHEVLSMERIHANQVSSNVKRLDMYTVESLDTILQYGPMYLSEKEYEFVKNKFLESYYRWLGGSILKLRRTDFWKYQVCRMRELGYPIPWNKVIKGAVDEIMDEMQNPKVAFHKLLIALKQKYYDLSEKKP